MRGAENNSSNILSSSYFYHLPLSLLVKNVVRSVSKQGTVVCMEKHFLGTRGAFGLHRVGAEEEDVAVRVAGGDVEVVGAPLGIEDGAVTLGLAVGLDTVAVVEEDLGGLEIPDDEMAIVCAGQEDVWQRGVRLQHVHLVLVRAQPVQQLAGVRTWPEKVNHCQ